MPEKIPDENPDVERLIALGKIVKTHGLQGEVRMRTFNPRSETIAPGTRVLLRKADHLENVSITTLRQHKFGLLLRFGDCHSIEEAEEFVGKELCVAEEDLPSLDHDEFYHYELVEMKVITKAGLNLGHVVEVMETGANDVLVVQDGDREHLIPFIDQVIEELDRESRTIMINPLPGMIEE